MQVLITGGAGYIGTHVALELLAANWEPVLLDNYSNASRAAVPALARLAGRAPCCIEGDIRDRDFLDGLLGRYDFNAVVHLAGSRRRWVLRNRRPANNNLVGTECLLECLVRAGVTSVGFSSIATVYASSRCRWPKVPPRTRPALIASTSWRRRMLCDVSMPTRVGGFRFCGTSMREAPIQAA